MIAASEAAEAAISEAAMSTNEAARPALAALTGPRCPATWDGWQCWLEGGQPSRVEYQPCPSYIYFHSSGGQGDSIIDQYACGSYAEKQCEANGRWFYNNSSGGEWTNYKTCSRVRAHLTQERVHMALYAISVVALTPAIIIFFAYK